VLPDLRTDRLLLTPVTDQHTDLLVELNSDPEVMAYIRGRAASRDETLAEWRQRLEHQSDPARGLGYWAGFEGGTFAGWWSASSFDGRPEVAGIGYRLRTESWGRGLATEGARAMVSQAFATPGIERVFASTMAINTGSRRVLEKLRMAHTRTWVEEWDEPIPGWEQGEVSYELTRAEWERRRRPG
jgi:RimJ/RimL family protein N-acetyltransferase